MRNSKSKFSQQEWEEHKDLVQRLIAGGADLDLSGVAQGRTKRLKITQYPELLATYACGGSGRSFYVVSVRIVAQADKVVIQHFDLSSPEWDLNAGLLLDPTMDKANAPVYRLGHCASFSRNEVLNHRVDDEGILRRGNVMQGVVLAESFDSIPKHYVHGSMMRLTISVWDQFDEVHQQGVQAWVEYPESRRPAPGPLRPSSLFEPGESLNTSYGVEETPISPPARQPHATSTAGTPSSASREFEPGEDAAVSSETVSLSVKDRPLANLSPRRPM